MEPNEMFKNQFKNYYGKRFHVVTGRHAYSLNKEKHARMLADNGIYLLLENPPQENLKYRYGRGLFIPAQVVDKFLSTNDPEKIKRHFTVAADTMRFEFHQQQHKLYEQKSCIIHEVQFEDVRRPYSIDRVEYEYLLKHGGEFIFLFIVGGNPGYLVQVESIDAEKITGFKDNTKKKTTVNFEMSAYTIKLLNDLGLFNLLTKTPVPEAAPPELKEPEEKSIEVQDRPEGSLMRNFVVDMYLNIGMPIRIILPEGKNELVLECIVTKQERREVKE
jgi:hypothetical protein